MRDDSVARRGLRLGRRRIGSMNSPSAQSRLPSVYNVFGLSTRPALALGGILGEGIGPGRAGEWSHPIIRLPCRASW